MNCFIRSITISMLIGAWMPAAASSHQDTSVRPQTTILIGGQISQSNKTLTPSKTTAALIDYLEKELNTKFTLKQYPWLRAMDAAERGEGMIYGIYKNKEREKKFIFSEPIFADTIWLVTRCDKQFPFNRIADLQGKTIGLQPGSSGGVEFDQGIHTIFKPEHTTTDLTGSFLRLYQGRMDAFIFYEGYPHAIEIALDRFNRQHAVKDKEQFAPIFCKLEHPVTKTENYFAISRKADQSMMQKINHVILRAKKNGDLDKIFSPHE
jgi:polar amino acid transport system substrate-binding protein